MVEHIYQCYWFIFHNLRSYNLHFLNWNGWTAKPKDAICTNIKYFLWSTQNHLEGITGRICKVNNSTLFILFLETLQKLAPPGKCLFSSIFQAIRQEFVIPNNNSGTKKKHEELICPNNDNHHQHPIVAESKQPENNSSER